ncbi:hypothetical protein PILCRDRAFT_830359 [Piloderma croceum F 1598]|uniref:Uncharacterized protein n=1 Tax=Piloderma croceum (strain F 1598) TaxID=765440 RepID=A0A0C3B2C8_PILCF|nr:hypothetical protein PILCRDRAFT_830359 [Piloderma croceum F 1598]
MQRSQHTVRKTEGIISDVDSSQLAHLVLAILVIVRTEIKVLPLTDACTSITQPRSIHHHEKLNEPTR